MPVLQATRGAYVQPVGGGAQTQIMSVSHVAYYPCRRINQAGSWTPPKADVVSCFGFLFFSDPDKVEYLVNLADRLSGYGTHDLIVKYAVDKTEKTKRFKWCVFGAGGILGQSIFGYGLSLYTLPKLDDSSVQLQVCSFATGRSTGKISDMIVTTVG